MKISSKFKRHLCGLMALAVMTVPVQISAAESGYTHSITTIASVTPLLQTDFMKSVP